MPLNEGVMLSAGPPFAIDSEGRVTKGAAIGWQDDYEREVVPEVLVLPGVRITTAREKVDGRPLSETFALTGRVPVSLDDGLATGLYFFFEPALITFDRPLPFKFPNSDKLAPRSPVLIMRYDSKECRWAREGTARVSDDGLRVINEDGSGIRGGGWYAFPSARTQPEFTVVDYLQIEGNERFEAVSIIKLEAYSQGKSAVLASAWGEWGFKRLHFRVTFPVLNGEIVNGFKGIEPNDTSEEIAVTVTPSAHVLEPGHRLILLAVGRPHPGGRYIWTSDDPSIASVLPFVNDSGSEHPNRANVIAHRPGKVKIHAMYITSTGATSIGTSEIICRQ